MIMNHAAMKRPLLVFLSVLCLCSHAFAQITVNGVADKGVYANQTTFTIAQAAGWTCDARLDGVPVPVGSAVLVNKVDYHELIVNRTNDATAAVESALYRFIIGSSERGGSENGIPLWTPPVLIPSATAEFAGAHLSLLAPAAFPTNCAIPIVAWVLNDAGHAVRANSSLFSTGHPTIPIKRGVGSGFLGTTNPAGWLNYDASLAGLQTHRSIMIESATEWTPIAGVLSGSIVWPPNSRIHVTNSLTIPAGSTLTIGAGTLVRLDSRVDIKLDGTMTANGTLDQPVVFFPSNPAQPWGGFLLELNSSRLQATGTIFTGSGAEPYWFGSNGRPHSHRAEQALFYCTNAPTINLLDSAAIYLAGQLGHSVNGGVVTLTRFLMQHTTSGGEFTGAGFTVNDSAFIECPDDTSNFVDGDNDALYIVNGTHGFTNTLFGWTKDDGVDSGGSGAGLLNFQDCWFENIMHEGGALSGTAKVVNHYHGVFINCGQGLESGYEGPVGTLDDCLLIGNETGGRFGDNYAAAYTGSLRATNSILIHNYRDIWGLNWQDWMWRTNAMTIQGNWLTAALPQHPDNFVWQPDSDAPRLAAFMTAPANASVGLGFALPASQFGWSELTHGLPVRLSTFTTQTVSVDYTVESPGHILELGTLVFTPGEILKTITPAAVANDAGLVRVSLRHSIHAELTGLDEIFFVPPPVTANYFLVSAGASWRYQDTGEDAGTDWRLNTFSDAGWSSGPAKLGYGGLDEATTIRSNGVSGPIITTYFRHTFPVAASETIGGLTLRLKRDDGGIVYLNGTPVFSSNMPNGPVDYLTPAYLAADNGQSWFTTNVPPALLQKGTNLIAVEIHQESTTNSDLSFDLSLEATPGAGLRLLEYSDERILAWDDASFILEQTTDLGPSAEWSMAAQSSPAAVNFDSAQRFYRLKKK